MLDETGKEIEIGVSDEERSKRRAVLNKTTGEELRQKFNQESREEIEQKEKALAPPVITEPRCQVCVSQWRVHIERSLIKGHSYKAIADSTPPDPHGVKPSRKSIASHYKNHMPIDRAAIRAELEAEADNLRQNYEEGVRGALTNRGILNVIIRKAYDDYMDGITTAEVKDIIQLVKLQNEMETDTATIKNEETEGALRIFMRAIQNVCEPVMQSEIAGEVKRLRELDAIEFQMEAHLEKPRVIEAPPEAELVHERTHPQNND